MSKRSADDIDTDNTDELPILLETVALEDAQESAFGAARHEDTAEHLFHSAADAADELAVLTAQAEQVPALETQIRALTAGARDLELKLAQKDRRLAELNETVTALRRAADDAAAADRQLAAQLAVRDVQLTDLTAALERYERDAVAAAAELQRVRGAAEAARAEADALRGELAARPAPDTTSPGVEKLREEYAALASYVAGRRSWWDELQATNAALAKRVSDLERELASGAKRLEEAEAFAARESARAVDLRAELVAYARRADALERELKLARTLETPATVPSPEVESEPPPIAAQPATLSPSAAAPVGATVSPAVPETPPLLTDAVDAVAPAVEAIAQLEAEVEYKRQQVAAQLVELREREQRLRAATSELGALRSELEDSRSSVARLERTIADKDRALEARDARIATLHEELKQRAEKRSTVDFALPSLESAGARPSAHDGALESAPAPVLICLTGDAPRRFALTKKTITVGRGPHCDLQILTHFVSREHARLTFNGGTTVIEDLGSRNGVFVNAIRVDRRDLQQGDLVTIGETQFRFVESMAH